MDENQAITIGALREELDKQGNVIRKDLREELDKQGNVIRKEFKEQGVRIKKDLKEEIKKQEQKFEGFIEEQDKKYRRYIDSIDGHFESHNALMAESIIDVREKIVVLTEMVEKNTEDIEIIMLNINLIRGDVKTRIERKEFTVLEKRVVALEQKEKNRVNC